MLALEHKKPSSPVRAAAQPAPQRHTLPQITSPRVQRAPSCTCGGSCPRCQAKFNLKVRAPNDAYEREADAVADRVMRMAGAASPVAPAEPVIQPKRATYEEEADDEKPLQTKAESSSSSAQSFPGSSSLPSSVHAALSAPGQPLAAETRAFFEPRFGHDFSGVRFHTDAAAEQSARDVSAEAYTVGRDIVFGMGRLAPETHEGRRLIAHELAHVIQQRDSRRGVIQRQPAPVDEFPTLGPQAQARGDVGNALLTASRKLAQAIQARDSNGGIAPDLFAAYGRFFAGSDLDKFDPLKARIDDATGWIQAIPFEVVTNPVNVGTPDAASHQAHLNQFGANALAVAMQPPQSTGGIYVALYYPSWPNASITLRTQVVFHELFHFFPNVRHAAAGLPPEPSWDNARAYQGFVGTLAGLPEAPGVTAMFPP